MKNPGFWVPEHYKSWFDLTISGKLWRVYLSAIMPPVGGIVSSKVLGFCHGHVRRIVIRAGMSDTYTRRVLLHEIMHAVMCNATVSVTHARAEESIIRALDLPLSRVLFGTMQAKLPPQPPGIKQWARSVRKAA